MEGRAVANNLVSVLPTKEEIESRAETMESLVVGLGNLLQYSTQGSGRSRNKKRDEESASRGVLAAERNVLRAIVPTTEKRIRTPITGRLMTVTFFWQSLFPRPQSLQIHVRD